MRSIEAYKARAVMKALMESREIGPAITELLGKADDAEAPAFERYAAIALHDAGASRLSRPALRQLRLQSIADGELVRLSMLAGSAEDREIAQALEDTLNRLLGICGALTRGIGTHIAASSESNQSHRRRLYEQNGAEYPLWSDTERGAHVTVPSLAPHESPTVGYFNELDWRMLDSVASNAHLVFQSAILANRNQVLFGVKAPHCTEWDVRTRLAAALDNFSVSLRLTYRFDCDTSRNTAIVHFNVPWADSFPKSRQAHSSNQLEDLGPLTETAITVYTLRLSALIGAACFGGGRVIEHALVVGKDPDDRTIVSCAFERAQFVRETLPVIDSGSFAAPELRFDPERVASALSATHVEYASNAETPLAYGRLECARANPWEDSRALPFDLQHLFHAKRVRDIDTSHYLGGAASVIDEAKADSQDLVIAAIAQLEGVVDDLEGSLTAPDDEPEARPLFCDSPLNRLAIALLDDDLNIGAEAEAFLRADDEAFAGTSPPVFYYRAPSALFHAHVGLADLYRKLGDGRAAEAQADRCMALGPTMPVGYALKADILAERGKFNEAANVLMSGLRIAIAQNDHAFLLHDLALVFWNMGRFHEAGLLHIYTASLGGIYGKKSLECVQQLAHGDDAHAFIRDHMGNAQKVMSQTGIPLIPEEVVQFLVAKATIGLAGMDAPNAAAPYAEVLAKYFPTNRTIVTACDSIRFGIG